MANMSDLWWVQWFGSCCCSSQSYTTRGGSSNARRQRLKIDRSMIGNPTNFVHTGHIGSADVELSTSHLHEIQKQMESKGGYYGQVEVRYYDSCGVCHFNNRQNYRFIDPHYKQNDEEQFLRDHNRAIGTSINCTQREIGMEWSYCYIILMIPNE